MRKESQYTPQFFVEVWYKEKILWAGIPSVTFLGSCALGQREVRLEELLPGWCGWQGLPSMLVASPSSWHLVAIGVDSVTKSQRGRTDNRRPAAFPTDTQRFSSDVFDLF